MKKFMSLSTFLIFVLLLLTPKTVSCARPETVDFAFAFMCDSRGENLGVNDEVFGALINHLVDHHPDVSFVLFPGDMITGTRSGSGMNRAQLLHWRDVMSPVYENPNMVAPKVFPAVGNHELLHKDNEVVFEEVYADVYESETIQRGPKLNYSFDHMGSHFAAVSTVEWDLGDPKNPKDDRKIYHRIPQLDWLEADLEDAFERGAKHIFVFGHESAFPIGGHLDDCLPDVGWFLKDTSDSSRLIHIEERDRFWNMLETYGVDAYICGHEHNYGRQSVDGVYQIVSGGAGGPLYELNPLFGDNPPIKRPGQSLTYDEAVPFYEMLGYPHGPGDNCQASPNFLGGKFFQYTLFRLSGPKVFVETWGIDPATGQRDVMEVDATIELRDNFVIEKRD